MSAKSVTPSASASAVAAVLAWASLPWTGENIAQPVPATQPDGELEAGEATPGRGTPETKPVAKPNAKAERESSVARDTPHAEAATPTATAGSPARHAKGKHREAKPKGDYLAPDGHLGPTWRSGPFVVSGGGWSPQEGEPDLTLGVVPVRVHQDHGLPGPQLQRSADDRECRVGRDDGGEDMVPAVSR